MPNAPCQLWKESHMMATAPLDSVQKCAPALPNELRAKTGKGIPYLEETQIQTGEWL